MCLRLCVCALQDNSVGSHCDDPEQFERDMDVIFQRVNKAKFGTTPLGGALLDVLRTSQRHHVRLDSKVGEW